jgi:hypothetical protein
MRRVEKKIILLSFYVMHIGAMEPIEVHPFMLSSVDQSLQAIKSSECYGLFYDEKNPALKQARQILKDHSPDDPWMYGEWEDGSQWKVNLRCGVGLLELLRGRSNQAEKMIADAINEDNSAWARYYAGLLTLTRGKKEDRIPTAFEHFKKAHEDNPHQIVSHWYRHIMAMAGWEAAPKDNWVTWLDAFLCRNHKRELGYPLAVYARKCNDTIGAEMLCLKVAATQRTRYQEKALIDLYKYSAKKVNGLAHPYAQEAEELLRNLATQKQRHYIVPTIIEKLDAIEKNDAEARSVSSESSLEKDEKA